MKWIIWAQESPPCASFLCRRAWAVCCSVEKHDHSISLKGRKWSCCLCQNFWGSAAREAVTSPRSTSPLHEAFICLRSLFLPPPWGHRHLPEATTAICLRIATTAGYLSSSSPWPGAYPNGNTVQDFEVTVWGKYTQSPNSSQSSMFQNALKAPRGSWGKKELMMAW